MISFVTGSQDQLPIPRHALGFRQAPLRLAQRIDVEVTASGRIAWTNPSRSIDSARRFRRVGFDQLADTSRQPSRPDASRRPRTAEVAQPLAFGDEGVHA
jgi:hypothetical protein